MSATALDTDSEFLSAAADAPAKLNLTLDVLGLRDDGFHELRSVAVGVGFSDRVTCRLRPVSGIGLTCTHPSLNGHANLAYRAAMRLAELRHREPALDIEVHKVIPIGAGLGGGSSDAATTLALCNHLWDAGLDRSALASVGAELGSDVPLFFFLPSALLRGRGECVEPVTLRWSGWVLLVFAGAVVSTPEVYRAWRPSDGDRLRRGVDQAVLETASAEDLMSMLSNHLEPAVFRVSPHVARAHAELDRLGMGPMRVSGAGSALFRLFDDPEAARHAAKRIQDRGIGVGTTVVAAPVGRDERAIVSEEC